jgi:hypothetical protein
MLFELLGALHGPHLLVHAYTVIDGPRSAGFWFYVTKVCLCMLHIYI